MSTSAAASSSSSSDVAGLHGGNYYDLTLDDNDNINVHQSPPVGAKKAQRRRREHDGVSVMDDGRAYDVASNSMTTQSTKITTAVAAARVNSKQPVNQIRRQQQQSTVIDLVNSSDDDGDGSNYKKPLHQTG